MKYWPFHAGDWETGTKHLSAEERGLYINILNFYYNREQPLPTDDESLWRIAGASSNSEKASVKKIMKEFFINGNGCWTNERCIKTIAEFKQKQFLKVKAANKRWGKDDKSGS